MGALPEQMSEFGFGGGLTEKEDSWLSSSGFATLQNCVQDKTGAIEKHPGYSVIPAVFRNGDANAGISGEVLDIPGIAGLTAPKLVKRGDLIGVIGGGLLAALTDEFMLQGRVSPWVCERRVVCRSTGDRFDCCCSGDWVYTAHELVPHDASPGGIRVVLSHQPSGETVAVFMEGGTGHLPSTGATQPRVVALDSAGTVALLYMVGTQGFYHIVTPDGVGAANAITLAADYDVTSDPGTNRLWVVYFNGTQTFSSGYHLASGTLTSFGSVTNSGSNSVVACSICVDVPSNRLTICWASYVSAGGGNFFRTVAALARTVDYSASVWTARVIWQSSLAEPITFAHQIPNLGIASSPVDGNFVVFTDQASATARVVGHWVSPTGVVEGGGVVGDVSAPAIWLRSRPAWDGLRMFFLADAYLGQDTDSARRAHLVLGVEPRSAAGKASPPEERFGVLGAFSYLTAGGSTAYAIDPVVNYGRISRPYVDGNGAWHFQSFELIGQAATEQAICDYALIDDDRVGQFAELGAATYINGAVLSQWDGLRVCEATFLLDPLAPVLAAASGVGMAPGNYTYAVTYGRMTATGEIVRSRPSLTTTFTLAGPSGGILAISAHPGPSNIIQNGITFVEFWRSEVGTTSPLYLTKRVSLDMSTGSGPVSYTDHAASNAGHEQIYSDGTNGEIANTPAPSPLSICQWRNRLWATDGEQIFYTKEAASTRGAEWSQAFFAISRGAPERMTAVAPLGETLVAFAEDSTSYVYGDAPGANGDGSTLVGPVPIISELGCTQPAGIGVMPDGLLVRTRRGLQLLNGKREYSYVGAVVEDTLAAFPRVRCARHISGTNRVWVCLATSDLTGGVALLFDTFHKTFSTVFPFNLAYPGQDVVQCSTIDRGGTHMFSVQSGLIYKPSASYTFGAALYSQQVETPWFKPNGPSGELRARRFLMLLKRLGASQLTVEIGYDYEDAYHYSIVLTDAQLQAMEGEPDTLKPRIPFPRQRCQAYRFRFTVSPQSTAGLRFVSLRMATSLRPGSGRLLSKLNSPASFTKS